MFATVRNRHGVVSAVEPYDGPAGRLHLVHVEYKDDQFPTEERLLWELEPNRKVLEPNALPGQGHSDPMPPDDFDAILRASRWSAANPYLDPDGDGPLERLPISSPFHGAVQVDDFQLVPLLKALRMPRVNLLIADDVGLGKTIEAGLILTELLLRRRIQRVLILTPASLRRQWRDEMRDKFALPFDFVDRGETQQLRRRLKMDANPWRSFSRIIASYHYLRQDDVLEQFLAACRIPDGSPHLPWDLLIVDECHNLMPSSFGDDSDLCKMLRLLAPQFEHRLFLSATPHNGHTRCFTGLLEILDPVRFSQTDALKPAEKARVQDVVLRRLKREINTRTNPPKFCTRHPPAALLLKLSRQEVALSAAFDGFRISIRKLMASGEGRRRRAGSFAVEILGKRLLSCPTAFAESWRRCKEGLGEERVASESEVDTVRRNLERETGDDRESQSREATAANVVGAWLKSVASDLKVEIAAVDAAVAALRLDVRKNDLVEQTPLADARFDALVALIEQLLRSGKEWRDDERLVVFTEYKTTLEYVVRRLRERFEPDRILTLFGGGEMDEGDRDRVKQAFNDASHRVRVLVATDAASEGLNLHETARYLLHFDCPWNPSKLEQRNGRIDRHGQARDVTLHHFVTDQDQDLKFLAHVIAKADEIREDLGSANELFDEAAHRRLVEGESLATVQSDLTRRIVAARGRAAIDADATIATGEDGKAAEEQLKSLAAEIDLDSSSLRETLESALAIRASRPQLECSDAPRVCKLLHPELPGWAEVIDDSLRLRESGSRAGAVARLAFSPDPFLKEVGGRIVFCPRPDVLLMHLAHPMLQRALSALTRRRFPGTGDEVSRWTVRIGGVPKGADGLVLLSVEELAVNDLRETFHHWVRTLAFPIRSRDLGEPLHHQPAMSWRLAKSTLDTKQHARARDLLDEIEPMLRAKLGAYADQLTARLREQLTTSGEHARKQEAERYQSRQAEISSLITATTMKSLLREIEELKAARAQGLLFEGATRLDELDRSIEEKQAEVNRRNEHHEAVRAQLQHERERILKELLPKRHTMSGPAQVFPVTIEVRLPGASA
jgi:SNF2 family DNA or RNA helicase